MENDAAVIMGKEVALNHTSSGYYYIPIDITETLKVEEVNAVKLDELRDSMLKKNLRPKTRI